VHDRFRDVWDGVPAAFLVMEYVDGVSLGQIIAEQRQLEPANVVALFVELLGILDYLHGRVPPVLHRDVKPSNIIVRPDGTPALVDFGSVRRVFLEPDEAASTVVGTYGYMPYEQYMGQASPASDLYALGATFLHLVTGRPPREFMTVEGRIQVPASLPGDARLGAVLAKLLQPSPAERFASARDVHRALLSHGSIDGEERLVRRTTVATIERRLAALPAAPRVIDGVAAQLLDDVAPSAWQLMDTSSRSSEDVSFADVLMLIFFSILTAGILPVTFLAMARSWRRRLRRFFRDGVPGSAVVRGIRIETVAFDQRLARVSYEFEADGGTHRDVDQVLPVLADRWQPGDRIQVLYIPQRGYESVIVGG
jgi:serine/threonine protein kinase